MKYKLQYKPIKILLMTLTLASIMSCKKFVQVESAPNLIQTNAIFSSDNTAISAVSGVYNLLTSLTGPTNSGLSVNFALLADETYATAPSTSTDPFYLNQLIAASSLTNAYYTAFYQVIYRANSIIEGLAKSTLVTDSLKQQLVGEMKVVRAMEYFYLVNLWGDVPLITGTDYRMNAILPRTPVSEVYHQIISDLVDAQNSLKPGYPSAGKARPNKWTATALLARAYLYMKDWPNAESQASALINSGAYSLLPTASIANVFLKNSSETIWELASQSETNVVGDASIFIPTSTTVKPTYALSSYLLNAFEPGDKRNQVTGWVGKNTVSSQDYYYPYKYKQKTIASGSTATEYKILLRVAEQYLIRAEAEAQQNNIAGAQTDLNKIRNRAGLSNTTATTQSALLSAIEKERQTEFFAEIGHRWLDLKRTGRADAVLGAAKGANWQSTDALFPIPQNELLYNPYLVQNPGY